MTMLVSEERTKAIVRKHYKNMSAKGASKGGKARMEKHYPDSPNKGAYLADHNARVLSSAYRLSPKHHGRLNTFQYGLSDYYKNDTYRTM